MPYCTGAGTRLLPEEEEDEDDSDESEEEEKVKVLLVRLFMLEFSLLSPVCLFFKILCLAGREENDAERRSEGENTDKDEGISPSASEAGGFKSENKISGLQRRRKEHA